MKKGFGFAVCGLFGLMLVGCVHKPKPVEQSVVQPVETHTHSETIFSDRKIIHPAKPHKLPSLYHWRCTVGNRHQSWHESAGTLVAAQNKAKHLCEMMSAGHGICRYKGCVQVESR